MTLADYEHSVAQLVTGRRRPAGAGEAVVRWSVLSWARLVLSQVCPLTTSILAERGRLEQEVLEHVGRGRRQLSPHAWGRGFVARLAADADSDVAAAASIELTVLTGLQGGGAVEAPSRMPAGTSQ